MTVSNRSALSLALLGLGLSACAHLVDPTGAQGKAVPQASAASAPVVAKANPAAAASAPTAAAPTAPPGSLRPFAEVVKATYPYYVIRLFGGTLFFAGMLIMAWNTWKTVVGQRAVDDARIPAVNMAHA